VVGLLSTKVVEILIGNISGRFIRIYLIHPC
jgi:hypothetical protein